MNAVTSDTVTERPTERPPRITVVERIESSSPRNARSSSIVHALLSPLRQRCVTAVLGFRIRLRHPSLRSHPTAIWDYQFHELDDIDIGQRVTVGPFAEIVVVRHSRHSRTEGRLILRDGSTVTAGCNLRAAGGVIEIGEGSAIGQHSVLVASNHAIVKGQPRFHTPYDESKTGVTVGRNVWVGANCTLVPGCVIGDNSVIAAGAVVRGVVPPNQLWGGVPAQRIKDL